MMLVIVMNVQILCDISFLLIEYNQEEVQSSHLQTRSPIQNSVLVLVYLIYYGSFMATHT